MYTIFNFINIFLVSVLICCSQSQDVSWKPVASTSKTKPLVLTVGNSITPPGSEKIVIQGIQALSNVQQTMMVPVPAHVPKLMPTIYFTSPQQQQQQGISGPSSNIQSTIPALSSPKLQNIVFFTTKQQGILGQPSNIQNTILPSPTHKIMKTQPIYYNNQQIQQRQSIQNIIQSGPSESKLVYAPPGIYKNNQYEHSDALNIVNMVLATTPKLLEQTEGIIAQPSNIQNMGSYYNNNQQQLNNVQNIQQHNGPNEPPRPTFTPPALHYNNIQQYATMYSNQNQQQQELLQQKDQLINQIIMVMEQQKEEDAEGKRILQELLQRKQRQRAKQKQLQQLLMRQQQMLDQERKLKEAQRNNMKQFEQTVDMALSELPKDEVKLNGRPIKHPVNDNYEGMSSHQGDSSNSGPVVTETIYYDIPPTNGAHANIKNTFNNIGRKYRRTLSKIADKFKLRPSPSNNHY